MFAEFFASKEFASAHRAGNSSLLNRPRANTGLFSEAAAMSQSTGPIQISRKQRCCG